LAPFVPFLSEELYQKMTGSDSSVHLLNYPQNTEVDSEVLEQMARTRSIITDALALRMQKSETEQQIKIRQPLAKLTYPGEKLPELLLPKRLTLSLSKMGKNFPWIKPSPKS